MNKKLLLIAAVSLALMVSLVGPAAVAAGPPEMVKVLIGFDRQPGPDEEGIVRGAGGDIKYTYHLVSAIAASVPEAAIQGLLRNPRVTRVEPDTDVYAIDAELDNAWGVKRIGAGTVHSYNKGTGIKVAIIDTGIDWNHPDLNANYKGGYDFVNSDNDPMDDNGHGTHVAGIVAAEDDGSGVVGVAPEVALYALKILGADGGGSYSDVIAALEWAVDNGIQVTNNSYGSSGDPGETVKAAFDNAYTAGVLHIAAAGNSGNPPGIGDKVIYPARWASVIAVAATDQSDSRARWSSTGPAVELAAPGVYVYSTYWDDTYATVSGTSMASPHVAGTAALVMVAYPGWTNVQVRSQLQNTADDLGAAGKDNLYGYGLVDADQAAPRTNTPPSVAISDPVDGATISGTYRVKVSASDSDGIIAKVEASINSASYIDISANFDGISYYFDWETTAVADGSHTLDARATDNLGATANAAQIAVSVDNVDEPPTVSIRNPQNGSVVAGTVTLQVSASDDRGLNAVEYKVDAGPFQTLNFNATTGYWEASWNTTLESDGPHTVTVRAMDTGGQSSSASVGVTTDNTAPVVSVFEPAEGATVSGTIVVKASVTEANIKSVEYQVDDGAFSEMGYDSASGYWEASWDTTRVANGSHMVTVRAIDKANNSGSDFNAVTVDNPVSAMHIASINMVLKTAGINTGALATVTIVDAAGRPVSGATVSGHWSGATTDSDSGVTNGSGQVTLQSDYVKRASSGTMFTFTVDKVELSGWTYDSAANVETSDSITVP